MSNKVELFDFEERQPKGVRWGSPHAVLTSLLGVEGAHFFGALLQDFFIDKHNICLYIKNLHLDNLNKTVCHENQI